MMKMAECEVRVVDERDGSVLLSGLFISHCLLSLPMVESERLQPSCTVYCTRTVHCTVEARLNSHHSCGQMFWTQDLREE